MASSILDKYDYSYPPELIAQAPAHPRDRARILIYNRKSQTISDDRFINLVKHLPANAVLVFNQTKVIPARFTVFKPSGGKVNLLYLNQDSHMIRTMADRTLTIGTEIAINDKLKFTVTKRDEKWYELKPQFPINKMESVLQKYGRAPLPPYIKHTPLSKQQTAQQYQTVFAKQSGSVAAPTASLHFSKRLMNALTKHHIQTAFVTLHVGLGTFAPVTSEQIKTKTLHYEQFTIDKRTATMLNQAKLTGRPIIAIGTTTVRTLESATNNFGVLQTLTGSTNLFIQENYKLKFVDGLITNFHVPRSSLLMLVSAFTGQPQLMTLYKKAVADQYKLFSFGDGMLIL